MSTSNPSDDFPNRLKQAREIRKLDQATLSKKAELPASSISHFESGSRKPSFANLKKLSNALNVTTDFLLGRTDDPEGTPEADPLYRNFKQLSDEQRKFAESIIKSLADKG